MTNVLTSRTDFAVTVPSFTITAQLLIHLMKILGVNGLDFEC